MNQQIKSFSEPYAKSPFKNALLLITMMVFLLSACGKTSILHPNRENRQAPQSAYGKADPADYAPQDVSIGLPTVQMGTPIGEIRIPPIRSGANNSYTSTANMSATLLSVDEARKLARTLGARSMGINSWSAMRPALEYSLTHAQNRPQASLAFNLSGTPGLKASWSEVSSGLKRMISLLPQLENNPELLATQFRWYKLTRNFGFTGYFEPTLLADSKPSSAFPHAIYRKPPDLVQGKTYHDRRAIDQGKVLAGKGLELAWVKDDIGLFFLHVQGSGRLLYPDGTVKHILYSSKNNRRYASLGAILREKGYLQDGNISMQSIRQVLLERPNEKNELMYANPSYVFFRLENEGPVGGMGYPLTPKISLAVDRNVLPYGSIVFFSTVLPDSKGTHNLAHSSLGLPQDTGGAIRGRRIDIFWGSGAAAENTAGYLNSEGPVYVLLPNAAQ